MHVDENSGGLHFDTMVLTISRVKAVNFLSEKGSKAEVER